LRAVIGKSTVSTYASATAFSVKAGVTLPAYSVGAYTHLDKASGTVQFGFFESEMSTGSSPRTTVMHEMFHGVDDRINMSGSDKFLAAVRRDMNDQTAGRLAQTTDGFYKHFSSNPRELFAEAAARQVEPVTEDKDFQDFEMLFPNTISWVRAVLDRVGVPIVEEGSPFAAAASGHIPMAPFTGLAGPIGGLGYDGLISP
jgi:hypothetical protein